MPRTIVHAWDLLYVWAASIGFIVKIAVVASRWSLARFFDELLDAATFKPKIFDEVAH